MKNNLTAEQLYQQEYWQKNKKRILLKRRTVWKRQIAKYMKEYFKRNSKKWKAYQKRYRATYYERTVQ